jgi:exodeoxyribonuclease VII large subunit
MTWSSDAGKLPFIPEDGMHVVARGRIDFYPPGGNCQLYVKSMGLSGAGEKFLLVERWKQELSIEGCFDPGRKQSLPPYPSVIGVVTSGTGAVLQDIKNIISRRYPLRIVLSPTAVQGERAHLDIAAAIKKIDGTVDVIIVARGGGSFEDLFPFNHPEVVRAIASCRTPVISAVGHEVDTTLADYAADARAPTPSAAAEMAVPDRAVLLEALRQYRCAMADALGNQLERAFDELATLRERIHPKKLGYRIVERRQNLDDMSDRLLLATRGKITGGRLRLNEVRAMIEGKSPLNILSRGYSVVEKEGKVVRSARALAPGDDLVLRLSDGKSGVLVREVSYDKEI